MPNATRTTRDRVIVAVAALAAAGGYFAGTAGTSTAFADGRPRHGGAILPTHFAPPAVAVEKGGFAVVGGADSRYYIVRSDGTSCVVGAGRSNRDQLYWR